LCLKANLNNRLFQFSYAFWNYLTGAGLPEQICRLRHGSRVTGQRFCSNGISAAKIMAAEVDLTKKVTAKIGLT
jgi:hypothetical protein